jgi:putative two-component system response regulator
MADKGDSSGPGFASHEPTTAEHGPLAGVMAIRDAATAHAGEITSTALAACWAAAQRLIAHVDRHDLEAARRFERCGRAARHIASALGLSTLEAQTHELAAALHDVGTLVLPPHLARRAGPLSLDDRAEFERHAEIGYVLLTGTGSPLLDDAATAALTHHERLDGSGYPRGLEGDEIPLVGRVAAVADSFSSVSVTAGSDAALAHLEDASGRLLDERVVAALARAIRGASV